MLPPRFRVCLKWIQWSAVASIFVACAPSRSVIDVGRLPVWHQRHVPSPCAQEFKQLIWNRPPDALEAMDSLVRAILRGPDLRDFGYELEGWLRFDACKGRPPVFVIRLGAIHAREREFESLDSLILPVLAENASRIPTENGQWDIGSRILRIGQEDPVEWSRRMAPQLRAAMASPSWSSSGEAPLPWLIAHAWKPNESKNLLVEIRSDTQNGKRADTLRIDLSTHRMESGGRL